LSKPLETIEDRSIQRFWNKVNKQEGCWEFESHKDRDGYHAFAYKTVDSNKFKKTGAHRFMMIATGKTIPLGYVVCHKCDNPSCVNPDHLFIGTVNDNNQDKVRKGRQSSSPGSTNSMAKLDESTAKKIKAEARVGTRVGYNNGSNIKEVANKYNVHVETVRLIAKGITWKHI